jgi:hypothetical protein
MKKKFGPQPSRTIRRAALCPRCAKGDHSGEHNKGVGCISVVEGSPLDFVCTCPEETRTRKGDPMCSIGGIIPS